MAQIFFNLVNFWWIACGKKFGEENFGESLLTGYFVKLNMISHTPPCFEFPVEVMVQGYQEWMRCGYWWAASVSK